MSYGHYEFVRLERELRLREARTRPLPPPRSRRVRGSLRSRLAQLPPRPPRGEAERLTTHEYLELEFAVED